MATSALEDENLRLQKSIERLGNQLSILEREKEELASDVVLAKATVSITLVPTKCTCASIFVRCTCTCTCIVIIVVHAG